MPNMVIPVVAVDLPLSGAWEQLRNREDRINDKKEKPQQRELLEANNEADRKEQHEDERKVEEEETEFKEEEGEQIVESEEEEDPIEIVQLKEQQRKRKVEEKKTGILKPMDLGPGYQTTAGDRAERARRRGERADPARAMALVQAGVERLQARLPERAHLQGDARWRAVMWSALAPWTNVKSIASLHPGRTKSLG